MKTAIVTGASGNMGSAVVKKFLAEGYYVIGTAVPNDPVDTGVTDQHFKKIIVDLSNEKDTSAFVQEVITSNKTIDVLVSTVGGFAMGSVAETTSADIYKQYQLNFETAYNVAKPVFAQMLEQNSGRIFLVGSKPGLSAKNGKGMVAYGLAKSLVFRLAELLNEEAKGKNVVTAVLVPSAIDSPQNRKSMPDADHSKWVTAEDIAGTVYFYCTEAAASLREPVIKLYNNG